MRARMEPWRVALQTGWIVGQIWERMTADLREKLEPVAQSFYHEMTDEDVRKAEVFLKETLIPTAVEMGVDLAGLPATKNTERNSCLKN